MNSNSSLRNNVLQSLDKTQIYLQDKKSEINKEAKGVEGYLSKCTADVLPNNGIVTSP